MIESLLIFTVISEQASKGRKAEYILSNRFRIVRNFRNEQPQRTGVFLIFESSIALFWRDKAETLTPLEFSCWDDNMEKSLIRVFWLQDKNYCCINLINEVTLQYKTEVLSSQVHTQRYIWS